MSLDAGGVAQMSYNQNNFNNVLGRPNNGFASRGKGMHLQRLSFAPTSQIGTIDEDRPAPRTSRSHMLAGLRTAPKSPTTAPPTQLEHRFPNEVPTYGGNRSSYQPRAMPQTATGSQFPNTYQSRQGGMNSSLGMNHMYNVQEQKILSPPTIQIGDMQTNAQDQALYNQLLRQNAQLSQQQKYLQQQLLEVTAATNQQYGYNPQLQPQYAQQMMVNNGMGFYNQQLQQGLQPVVQAVAGTPGLYTVYNPMTGQTSYFLDQNAQNDISQRQTQTAFASLDLSHSPPPPTPTFRAEVSPPPESPTRIGTFRNPTPPKATPSPPQENVSPLPPPSANAFRPSHRKTLSLATRSNNVGPTSLDSPSTNNSKSTGFPQTPMTGTFGPGQARSGEHPLRQPRGPPAIEELLAKPTAKFEGSKNFATRQRRTALSNIRRAGLERMTATRTSGSLDGNESSTPSSESEITFSISSEADSDSVSGSASLLGQPSIGDLYAVSTGAIGSERKELKERSRASSPQNDPSITRDDNSERRKASLAVLSNAEKRKSSTF
ncbi:hypothetical protein MMC25_008302 [Agyrium rufum]|nr:hypothetical protein [Agyrium rufum]